MKPSKTFLLTVALLGVGTLAYAGSKVNETHKAVQGVEASRVGFTTSSSNLAASVNGTPSPSPSDTPTAAAPTFHQSVTQTSQVDSAPPIMPPPTPAAASSLTVISSVRCYVSGSNPNNPNQFTTYTLLQMSDGTVQNGDVNVVFHQPANMTECMDNSVPF